MRALTDSAYKRCPRQDSNLRTRFRKPMLYPLSYGSISGFQRPFPKWCSHQHNLNPTLTENRSTITYF